LISVARCLAKFFRFGTIGRKKIRFFFSLSTNQPFLLLKSPTKKKTHLLCDVQQEMMQQCPQHKPEQKKLGLKVCSSRV
jgi:hypothetical protein